MFPTFAHVVLCGPDTRETVCSLFSHCVPRATKTKCAASLGAVGGRRLLRRSAGVAGCARRPFLEGARFFESLGLEADALGCRFDGLRAEAIAARAEATGAAELRWTDRVVDGMICGFDF